MAIPTPGLFDVPSSTTAIPKVQVYCAWAEVILSENIGFPWQRSR